MATKVVKLVKEKETKNTIKFIEEGDGPKVLGGLYVGKWVDGIKSATMLTVTVEMA